MPVGFQLTLDDGRIGTDHTIERHRCGIRLYEFDTLVGTDTEVLPVDDELGTRLMNDRCVALRRHRTGPCDHLAT